MTVNLFEEFVNMEMPKRVFSDDDVTSLESGMVPVAAGVGLKVEFKRPSDVPGLGGGGGQSAYELAVAEGFVGTEEEWLESLVGPVGMSVYDHAVEEGYEGTLGEWLKSLVGPMGPAGENGVSGPALNILGSVTLAEFHESIVDESECEL